MRGVIQQETYVRRKRRDDIWMLIGCHVARGAGLKGWHTDNLERKTEIEIRKMEASRQRKTIT